MNKRHTRIFAFVSTGLAILAFFGLTLDSHRQFPKLTNAQNITPAVLHGKDVWHNNNCINCHTLFGEGAYYAPDLTKITQLRGEQYLHAYLRDPSQFYSEQRHRRLMPKQNLTDTDIADVIAFLDWVSKVDNQGWPPRPILVSGATIPGTDRSTAQQAAPADAHDSDDAHESESPVAKGQKLFSRVAPACNSCHSIAPGVNMVGPSLAGVGTRAAQTIASPAYKGKAKDVRAYIRESVIEPSAHVVPGPMYSANGVSFMPNTYGKDLKPEHIDELVAYIETLK